MSEHVRAKFVCQSVATVKYGGNGDPIEEVKMVAVWNSSEENKKFWASSPNGQLSLSYVTPGLFIPGREYYLDFTLCEAPVAAGKE